MKLTIDFETRSAIDLKKVGAWRYAEDPTTAPWCLAVKVDDQAPRIWINSLVTPPGFNVAHSVCLCGPNSQGPITDRELDLLVKDADIIEAHNAEFERALWRHTMHARYGFPDLPLEKLRCSASVAASYALPRKLEDAGRVLGLPIQKDMEGHRLMLKWCKPRKPLMLEKSANPNWSKTLYWHHDPAEFVRLCAYCMRDVDAEYALSERLGPLGPAELEVWRLDQTINERGVFVDRPFAEAAVEMLEDCAAELLAEFKTVTERDFTPKQLAKFWNWLGECGLELPNMQAATVEEALGQADLRPEVRRALEIRRELGKSSTAKYEAALRMQGEDGRVRGLFLYHGADTGRWAGQKVQVHNLPRGTAAALSDDLQMENAYYAMSQPD